MGVGEFRERWWVSRWIIDAGSRVKSHDWGMIVVSVFGH